ncbi:MAG: endopeptidase La [Thermodesulfobacteriota bacterium]|nr:endopeptidase La [Thermodesulfobacteriota bacterium]
MTDRHSLDIYPLLYLNDIVVLPHMILPLFIERETSIAAVDAAYKSGNDIVVCCQTDPKVEDPSMDDISHVGVLAGILHLIRLPNESLKIFIEGKSRRHIKRVLPNSDYVLVEAEDMPDRIEDENEAEAIRRLVVKSFKDYNKVFESRIDKEIMDKIISEENPSALSDMIASYIGMKSAIQKELLEETAVEDRLQKIYTFILNEIEIYKIEERLRTHAKEQIGSTQRYHLNEQARMIQGELSNNEGALGECAKLEQQLKKKNMPQAAREKALAELKRLEMMPPMSAEATVVRNYVDWFMELPWNVMSPQKTDIKEAEQILNEDHYGLDKVKERILEYLAVHHLVGKVKGPILCFVGPPGVGKTSLGRSIARATGRKFVRVSLGGVRDEAEIKGHRRTYIGALPGKIIQGIKRAGTSNPVFLLDEVDKMSVDFRGDPSAALLEVLDPEQNYSFSDHYIDIDYDISKVMFITIANNLYAIPAPLMDRMEIIRIEGYTAYDKLQIAKNFLIPKQIKAHGLSGKNVTFTNKATNTIIREYTREAGVRNIEKEISSICRKIAKNIVQGSNGGKLKITESKVHQLLGVPRYRKPLRGKKDFVGVSNGLAWTEAGGELLIVEATVLPGKGNLLLTGKLGDVMQESAQAAMSYVRSKADQFGLALDFYNKTDIHIHIPEGAIPKDGPSAGITMATSIVSALTKRSVKAGVAMTGELTLSGRVLPIGGLKEKLLAAREAGMEVIIIPQENEKDLKEVAKKIVKDLDVRMVGHMDEVIKYALN